MTLTCFTVRGNITSVRIQKRHLRKSSTLSSRQIKLDPNYALAYAGLALTYQFMGTRGFSPPKDSAQKVEWAALKALQIDDTLAEAHVFLGMNKITNFD